MIEQIFFGIKLQVQKDFFDWLWAYQLNITKAQAKIDRANSSEISQFNFLGKYGCQFKTQNDLTDFIKEFDRLLKRFKIKEIHKAPLLYFILYLNMDSEWQSINNNIAKGLKESADFLIDFDFNCRTHEEQFEKNPEYKKVIDTLTGERFYAKRILNMSDEELSEYFPDIAHADDIIRYVRISVSSREIYIPNNFTIGIFSKNKLKSLEGTDLENLIIPQQVKYEVWGLLLNKVLEQHKTYNTEFYKDFMNPNISIHFFKEHYKKVNVNKINELDSLKILCLLIGRYLNDYKLVVTYSRISEFVFEYLALFKAHLSKKPLDLPESYMDLIPFYKNNGINKKTIELRMKGVWDF